MRMMAGRLIKSSVGLVLLLFFIQRQTQAFKFLSFASLTHGDITRVAILKTTADVCSSQAAREGRTFVRPVTLTEESLAAACSSSDSAKAFKRSIKKINLRNAWVDVRHVFNAQYHFDDQTFLLGRDLITSGLSIVKASVKQQSYDAARYRLGEILHTLQDFYSHSNWIEMGNRRPFSNLIKPSSKIDNIADSATCRSCDGDTCKGNILESINVQQKLTSGYFDMFSSKKPEGKCSHGGFLDRTSRTEPKGGINKDTIDSVHGYLHEEAAGVAIAATRELLEDVWAAVGDAEFLRLMGFTQTSVLCFVIDTTGSMSDDIAEVRRVTSSIIDSKTGSTRQPSEYILVPFNDPDFGPLIRTTDPNVFKSEINKLTASGGGDAPEMSLSGLQLALTGSPTQSEIFVFTDADAKDKWLKGTVLALIERTKSAVTFLLTNALGARRRRSNVDQQNDQRLLSSRLSNPLNEIYRLLAQASGGQAIEVTKATLSQATSIIVETSSTSVVTVFQAVRNTGNTETFSFSVDSSLQNMTIYITGNSPFYNITSPSGASQTSAQLSGVVGLIEKVGNFHTVRLNISGQNGQWFISISSVNSYTIKVLGQSGIDFLFDFVELFDGPHPSYTVLNGRPTANSNATLLISMAGGDSVRPTDVALVEASSSKSINGTLKEIAIGLYLVTINSLPAGEFVLRVIGENSLTRASSELFQRQSSIQLQTSGLTVTAQADGTLEPGKSFTLPFTVATNGSGGTFTVRVTNDRSFTMTDVPSTLTLESGGSANATVTLTAPASTLSGTDVTVTVEAEAPGGTDTNYAVLRFSVAAPVNDINPPVCEIISVNGNCSGICSMSSWDLSANITDRNGSGVQSLSIRQGNGTLNTSTVLDQGVNVTLVFYSASCCYPVVELTVVDGVGNVGTCFRSLTPPVTPSTNSTPTSTNATAAPTILNITSAAEDHLFVPVFFWLTVGITLLHQFMRL